MSMLWIILGHTLTTNVMNGIANPAVLLPPDGMLASFPAQLFMTSRFAVDTFFFISGFLVSISLLRRLLPKQGHGEGEGDGDGEAVVCASNATTTSNYGDNATTAAAVPTTHAHAHLPVSVWLPNFYLHRLLRILPPYSFCLLLWWKVGVLLGSGPFWMKWNQFSHRCDLYAWTNLLFINNLHPYSSTEGDQCFYVSWYLANDMQFYLISPLFVLAFVKSKRVGVLLTTAVVLISCL
jgi:peptidoglycan/LPS O-acetylase OafA/YrhL